MMLKKEEIHPKSDANGMFEMVKTIVVAGLIALTIRSLAFEPFSIPSGSMIPNLLVQDYLFVSKSSYGYSKYSFPAGIFPLNGRINATLPNRGDVVVFRKPDQTNIDYIKRVIGLPGDTVQMRRGRLYINGQEVAREFAGEYKAKMPDGSMLAHKRYKETLPGGMTHDIIEISDEAQLDNTPEFLVPMNHYFMMGDNRDGSQDSRVIDEVGYVPFENFVGHATRIFFSVDDDTPIWQIWNWPANIRYDRLGKKIP